MKKLIRLVLSVVILVMSFGMLVYANTDDNKQPPHPDCGFGHSEEDSTLWVHFMAYLSGESYDAENKYLCSKACSLARSLYSKVWVS